MNAGAQIAAKDCNDGLWLSLTDLAKAKGVTKQTISEKVTRLERDSALRTRRGLGGAKLVDVAQYDRLVGETSDLARVQAASTARALRAQERGESTLQPGSSFSPQQSAAAGESANAPAASSAADSSFAEAQKRKTQYEAAIKALDFGERSGQLVATRDVEGVVHRILDASIGAIDALALRADEIAAAASRNGVAGVRQVLNDAVFKLKASIANAWRELEAISRASEGAGVEVDLELPEEEVP